MSRYDNVTIIDDKKEELKSRLIDDKRSEYLMLSTLAIHSAVRKSPYNIFKDYVEVSENYKVSVSKREEKKP